MIFLSAILIDTLPPYLRNRPLNISAVADYLQIPGPPLSMRNLVAQLQALPESVTFQQEIVTGTALGGETTMVLHRDGSAHFSGHMRATGIPSFSFRIGAIIRSRTGGVNLATYATGKVFGTDTPGERQSNWDLDPTTPDNKQAIANAWPDISKGSMVITRTTDLAGLLGTTVDIVKDVAEFLLVAETGGTAFAICIVLGGVAGNAPGLGGVLGIGIIAGGVFIWGPLAIGPAFLIGVAVGAIVDALIKIRELTEEEKNFARVVFNDSIDYDRIRLTNLNGLGGKAFTIPTIDDRILINIGAGPAFDDPINAVRPGDVPGQLLIHELTHAWQIENFSIEDAYVPGYLCRGVDEQVIDGQSAYDYGPAGATWRSYGLEGQATMVDQWFGGNRRQTAQKLGTGIAMDKNSPYFQYIDNNLRAGIPG